MSTAPDIKQLMWLDGLIEQHKPDLAAQYGDEAEVLHKLFNDPDSIVVFIKIAGTQCHFSCKCPPENNCVPGRIMRLCVEAFHRAQTEYLDDFAEKVDQIEEAANATAILSRYFGEPKTPPDHLSSYVAHNKDRDRRIGEALSEMSAVLDAERRAIEMSRQNLRMNRTKSETENRNPGETAGLAWLSRGVKGITGLWHDDEVVAMARAIFDNRTITSDRVRGTRRGS